MRPVDPNDPRNWQTAYTREDAYRESERRGERVSMIVMLPLILVFSYFTLYVIRSFFHNNITSGGWWWVGIRLGLILLGILFFSTVAQKWADWCSRDFFTKFYRPPENIDVRRIINERLYGKVLLPGPLGMLSQFRYILVKDGEIVKKDDTDKKKGEWPSWMARYVGGPILLIVFDGNALYLERGNQFSRVVGPGPISPFLEWFETIKYVVDLRPKIKTGTFDVWTKDGIKIRLTARVESRIGDPAKHDPSGGLVYPYDPLAVKKAVERYALRWTDPTQEPSEFTWVDAVWGQVTGILPSYIGSRYLDDLLLAEKESGQILSAATLKEVFDKLNQATQVFGVFVTDFQIVKVDIPEEIRKLQEEFWKTERESIIKLAEGRAKALQIRSQEQVRAEAQRDLILAIADGLERKEDRQFLEPVLLSLSSILDESLNDPLLRAYLARETLETLEKLQLLLDKK